jgi:hypothetical protein
MTLVGPLVSLSCCAKVGGGRRRRLLVVALSCGSSNIVSPKCKKVEEVIPKVGQFGRERSGQL